MTDASVRDMMEYVLDRQVKLTRSRIGWVGLVKEDEIAACDSTRSESVVSRYSISEEPARFFIRDGGLWAEAVRERRVLIVNDYAEPHPAKRGCPEGHIPLFRFMAVPLLDEERVVAVATVGNKEEPYNSSDTIQVGLLLDGMWKILKRKHADEERKRYTLLLEQSNRELEDFAFVASHDLQEPLRKIQIFASRLTGMPLPERGADYVERMQLTASRMQDLILDLLKYSRVTKKPAAILPVDLKRAAEEAVADLTMLMEETDGFVEVGDLPTVDADAVQMRQLFQNLIANALKYCEACKPMIKVYSGRDCVNGNCEIFVEDNGIGFDEVYLDRIFKPFQRLHAKLSCYRGTGMGLAICRRIVERHGGSITAKSKPGQGSVFVVTLPLKKPRMEALH
jgi:light-regulated signal transduction histidine kinase (bacteriophytochrome)